MIFSKNRLSLLTLLVFQNFFIYSFSIKSLVEVLDKHSDINYQKVLDSYPFNYYPFFNKKHTKKEIFDECFVLSISNGLVQGTKGLVFLNDTVIKEMIWAQRIDFLDQPQNTDNYKFILGSVAVIAQFAGDSYCHFMHEALGRLALLEMQNIQYDYLYVSYLKPFVYEMLELWGIDFDKIIIANQENSMIKADKLILPSLVINSDENFKSAGFHPHPITSNYVRDKLLNAALKLDIDISKFSKKVFISRKDAPLRKIINEDDVFELFKPYGFVRYELSKLTVSEQIMLMYNADIVVGEHGAGLTNILFCKPNSLVIELFQELIDSSNWWIANIANLRYVPINILNQDTSWAADWKNNIQKMNNAWSCSMVVTLDEISKAIDSLKAEF